MTRILLIHHRLPFPAHSGMDKTRFSLIKILNQKFKVSLVILSRTELSKIDINVVKSICSELIIIHDKQSFFYKIRILKRIRTLFLIIRSVIFHMPVHVSNNYSRKFKNKINRLVKDECFDIVQPLSDFSMDYSINLKTEAFKFFGPNDDMVGMTDGILSMTENKIERQLLKIELRARRKWQEKMIKNSDKTCYFSKDDIKNIDYRNPKLKDKLIWMPGVIEYENGWNNSSIYSVEKNTLVFTGGLVSAFNRKSLIYFFKNIWPLITLKIQDVKLFIVGQSNGETFQKEFSYPNVIYTGMVRTVQPFLESAAVFVSPVVCGTGIKTKIIEAIRFGKPVVSTPEGVSGLWELPSDTIKIRSNPIDFASEVIRLLKDTEYRVATSLNSRNLFEEHYSFDILTPQIINIYDQLKTTDN